MSDYRQRFEEVFPSIMGKHNVKNFPKEAFYDILAFMDELGTEKYADGFKQGRFDTRATLIAKVEGMRKELFVFAPRNSQASETNKLYNFYNQALDGVLHLLDESSRL